MDIGAIAEMSLDSIPELIRDLQAMVHDADSFSPKQRVDAGKALTSLLALVLDRTHPKLTSNQQTNVNVDVVKVLANVLEPGQAKRLADKLGMQALDEPKVIDVEELPSDEGHIDTGGEGTGETGGASAEAS